MMMMRQFFLLALASLIVISASATACVIPFDTSKFYFASYRPFVPTYATTFSIDYGKSYKVITVKAKSGTTIITLSVCGAPLPSRADLGLSESAPLVQFSLPLTAGVSSTTYAPFIETLGARSSISVVSGSNYFSSPCIRSSVASNSITDVADDYGSFVTTSPAAIATGVIFRGVNSWDILDTNHDVPVAETEEALPLGVAEYLFYFAAFFDAEATAAKAFKTIEARFTCASSKVSNSLMGSVSFMRPNVLWAYRFVSSYGGPWYVASCPNSWYCPLVTAAGGNMLVRDDKATSLTDAQFAELAKTATHFVYTGSDWDANLASAAASGTGALGELLTSIPAVQNKMVFDVLGSGVNQWFDTRPVAPDTVLQDLLLALNPSFAISKTPVFIRNVFTQTAGTLAPISTCTAAVYAAPLAILSSDACDAPNTVASSTNQLDSNTATIVGSVIGVTCAIAVIAIALHVIFAGGVTATAAAAATAAGVPAVKSAALTIAVVAV